MYRTHGHCKTPFLPSDFCKRTVEEFICRGYSPNQMSSNPSLISVGYIKQKQKVWILEQISLDLTEIRLTK